MKWILTLIWFPALYLVVGFVVWDFNPAHWGYDARFCLVMLSFLGSFLTAIIHSEMFE